MRSLILLSLLALAACACEEMIICEDGNREIACTDTLDACNAAYGTCRAIPCDAPRTGPSTCIYDGKEYAPGDSFPATDGCNTCSCSDTGDVACTLMACLPDGWCETDADCPQYENIGMACPPEGDTSMPPCPPLRAYKCIDHTCVLV